MGPMNAKPIIPFFTALAVLLVACEDSDTSGPPDAAANLSVFLTDAPGNVEKVWVEILGITLHHSSDGPMELLGAPTELIPLTDLVGTSQLLVADVEMDVSTYNQLRLMVGDAVLLSSEGDLYVKGDPTLPAEVSELPTPGELICPSCSQSGLKVTIPNDEMALEEGDAALVLDFDVAQSFGHRAGNSGRWVMHPVIHGTLTDAPATALAVSGTVNLVEDGQGDPIQIPECPAGEPRSIQDFIPTATTTDLLDGDGNPIVRTGEVQGDGTFSIDFLAPGAYSLGHEPGLVLGDNTLTFSATVEPSQVTLGEEAVSGVVYTIESAQCQ